MCCLLAGVVRLAVAHQVGLPGPQPIMGARGVAAGMEHVLA
jgi:hypothetical protein